MWLIFAVLSMFAYAATDLLGKRKVDVGSAWAPLELFTSSSTLAFVVGIVLSVGGFGESGRTPWTILANEPLIFVTTLCFSAYWLLGLVSFRYLGLSVSASVGGTNGIVFFIGMLLVNMVAGRLSAAREMMHPARLVPILVALTGVFLLSRLEKAPDARRRTVVGMTIVLLAMIVDGLDTLVTAVIFDAGRIGPVDYMIAGGFAAFLMLVLLLAFLRVKDGLWIVPFRGGACTVGYAVTAILASTLYVVASSHDAVRTGLAFAVAPVFPLVGARIFLKERYSPRQNLCIGIIVLAAIAFCIFDQLI